MLQVLAPHSPTAMSTTSSSLDLRVRTLSTLVSAFQALNPALFSVNIGCPTPDPVVHQPDSPHDSEVKPRLKLLNHLAMILIREREIVAVLSKRSGLNSGDQFVFTTDSDSDPDPESPTTKPYVIAHNPRYDDLGPWPDDRDVVNGLHEVTDEVGMLDYLNKYRGISFSGHVASIELLFNRIIDKRSPENIDLLKQYVSFRAVPKMSRRFNSPGFERFEKGMNDLSESQIVTAVDDYFNKNNISEPPKTKLKHDHDTMSEIIRWLDGKTVSKFPILANKLPTTEVVDYTPQTAWEFHQILLATLEMAKRSLAHLVTVFQAINKPVDDQSPVYVELWMNLLFGLIHGSDIMKTHIKVIEDLVAVAMASQSTLGSISPDYQATTHIIQPETTDNDDTGPSETEILIRASQQPSRLVREFLWLAVSFQYALSCLTARHIIPKRNVTLTIWGHAAGRETNMEPWQDVIRSMYPATSSPSSGEGSINPISAEEAISTLEEFSVNNKGKAKLFRPGKIPRFSGAFHAEAVLGTLVYLSNQNGTSNTQTQLAPQVRALFQGSFLQIGVSKRCCPVCVKLLSLLSVSDHNLQVLSAHKNFYATALPPHLPKDIARRLIEWLEGMVKTAVDNLIREQRELQLRIRKSSRSSEDSRGHSPGGMDDFVNDSVVGSFPRFHRRLRDSRSL